MDYNQNPKRVSRRIREVVKNYQSAAVRSLCGPDNIVGTPVSPSDVYYYCYPTPTGPVTVASQIPGVSGGALLLSPSSQHLQGSPVVGSRHSLTPTTGHNPILGVRSGSSTDSSRAGSTSPASTAAGGVPSTAGPTSPRDRTITARPSSSSSSSAAVVSTKGRLSSGPSSSSAHEDDEEVLVYDPHLNGSSRRGAMSSSTTSTIGAVSKLPSEKGLECDPFRSPPPYPIQQMPVFTPYDSYAERSETLLENERIACFIIGGEKRLCLPQILNSVLRRITLTQINAVCDELHIFCARCSPEQLEVFIAAGILPCGTGSCGLITKTDAERLCHALLHKQTGVESVDPPSHSSFKVYHECFGKSKGIFQPDLYKNPESECIYCTECYSLFNPPQFVCHSHLGMENRICHWGFDSANWRNYLMLAKDQENLEACQEMIEQMKNKFDGCKSKRKSMSKNGGINSEKSHYMNKVSDEWIPGKRVKTEETSNQVGAWSSPHHSAATTITPVTGYSWQPSIVFKDTKFMAPNVMRDSLFYYSLHGRNVPAFLQTGPPVLLHPERVVPHSESSRYERHFTPNVSLAPLPQQRTIETKIKTEIKDTEIEHNGLHELADAAVSKISSKEPMALTKDVKAIPQASTSLSKEKEKGYEYLSDSDESIAEFEETVEEPLSPKVEDTYEVEMEMVKQALEGQVGDSPEAKRKFLSDYTSLRSISQQRMHTVDRSRLELRGLLAKMRKSAKNKITRCIEKKKRLRKKLENMRIETECRLHDAEEGKESLLKEIETLTKQKLEPTDLQNKYIQATKDLHLQVQHYESMFETLNREIAMLQDEILKRDTPQRTRHSSTLPPPPPSTSSGSGLHPSPIHHILSSSSTSSKSPTLPEQTSLPGRSSHSVDRIKSLYPNRNKSGVTED